ncbi:unnamed protein product (macronuclear) [Paramecium tetraurelia]|uniref:Uncharacterized protein n=1 Tax=Paramecium tetraurelia TaxID=5888 RepID=A0E2E4_PARTE|nr:uncharacterized protein GSPATT00022633001 [Paramecium tetraurelia]CAK89461.1 unnamed protein product [Paramecium tetraurelia]
MSKQMELVIIQQSNKLSRIGMTINFSSEIEVVNGVIHNDNKP